MTDYTELKRLAEHHHSLGHAYTVATPSAVLALIAENESLHGSCKAMGADMGKLTRERNSFRSQAEKARAEVAGLRTGYEAYERVNAELKAENEALRKNAYRLQSATAFVQKLCDSAGKQPSVATGYLHDILAAMGKGEQS